MTAEPTRKADPNVIGLALSGGGHRATAYALGVLLYLVDSGLNTRVRTIASVSGGSILNAFVALLTTPDGASKQSFRSFAGFGSFDAHAARLASLLAGNRTVWFVCVAGGLLAELTIVVLFLFSVIDPAMALVALALWLVVLSMAIGPRSGGSLWGWWGTWLYCSSIAWLFAAAAIAGIANRFNGAGLVTSVALCGWLVQQRHVIAEMAYERTVCRRRVPRRRRWSIPRMRLEDMTADVRHVFCATEMHSGKHAYFSHDVVYARGFGLGRPAGLPVATAVQVSANFPGGFPIRPLRASRFEFSVTDRFEDAVDQGFAQGRDILTSVEDLAQAVADNRFVPIHPLPSWLMLTDGGVFDNLAVDWFLDSKQRCSRFLMRLNWDWDAQSWRWLAHGTNTRDESILDPLRDASDCIIVVNAGLTSHWQRTASAQISVPVIGELIGFSRISSAMYNNYTKDRIRAVEEHVVIELGGLQRLVPTTLLPLGEEAAASLMRAGYSDANRVAHRRFGHPYLETAFKSEEFVALARGRSVQRTVDVMETIAPFSPAE
jgi:predicted acylesterase/phospholipase RssA